MNEKLLAKDQAMIDAERRIGEMQALLSKQIEDQVQNKISIIDKQHQIEKQQLMEQMNSMKGSYLDLRSNLYKNEQIRKI